MDRMSTMTGSHLQSPTGLSYNNALISQLGPLQFNTHKQRVLKNTMKLSYSRKERQHVNDLQTKNTS